MWRLALVSLLLFVVSCANAPERQPLPPKYAFAAEIPGVSEARFWGKKWPTFAREKFEKFTVNQLDESFSGIYNRPHNYLAISGGGANGAFGVGVLIGWTAAGNRPEFTMVTGVSTGALTAPFAFLGSDYDEEMREVYTTINTEDIARQRNLLSAIFGDSVADTEPLQTLIEKYIDKAKIEAIAREHQKGRRLFIGTVNLDAGRSVVWNIGEIAVSDYPHKMALIHQVLRASASIPVAFPPVVIPVEAAGQRYDELHVDGGTGSQVFVYPADADWRAVTEQLKVQGTPQVYVIRNSFLDPEYQEVRRNIVPIASRTIESLIRTQGLGDLYQIYALCKRDGNDFNLAYIPKEFSEEPAESFDPVYMKKLLDFGYQMAVDGYPWEQAPPVSLDGSGVENTTQ
ncbi:patatin-like phospholipase family protein [Biformimicrobium ophioploci]|uniref:Patatin-like phospholipase family protein n=2 Tax=Biformimicrobium ophioploci TaxID=3036711 RepID=A0ABQ6M0E3_9GAMM|nr:patatin-like phospholipase family protein [Microbulbifer sp. NKW57]